MRSTPVRLAAGNSAYSKRPYPMKTKEEAIHFMLSAEIRTGKSCFVREVTRMSLVKWKILSSEGDYMSYMQTGKHRR
jgi:hypothetical protein